MSKKPRAYRGDSGVCAEFAELRLAASPLHNVQFLGGNQTTLAAVFLFIEKLNVACLRRDQLIERLGQSSIVAHGSCKLHR